MLNQNLNRLIEAYKEAPLEFQATSYWEYYEEKIFRTIQDLDINHLRSGKYPVLASFGFNDVRYYYRPKLPLWKKFIFKLIHKIIDNDRPILPYKMRLNDIHEIALQHCILMGKLTNSEPIQDLSVSTFGSPGGIFSLQGNQYTIPFLNYYLRYCFANDYIHFKGDEIIVELGSGSGYQIEVLKKIYPDLTVLCFDLPAQIYLCQEYLSNVLGADKIQSTNTTLEWENLSKIKSGCVHFFGSWQFPLLKNFNFDLFWNAASFGEMEPHIVRNYLGYIEDNPKWIYLLQAMHGKETSGEGHVNTPTTLDDYKHFLPDFQLIEQQPAWRAHRKMNESGGYFEGIWQRLKS